MCSDSRNQQEILLARIAADLATARDLLMEASLALQDVRFELDVQQRREAGEYLETFIACSKSR